MFFCCDCCVLSGRGLCDELITRPEESYRLCCVLVCDLENLANEEAMTRVGSQRPSPPPKKKSTFTVRFYRNSTRKILIYCCWWVSWNPVHGEPFSSSRRKWYYFSACTVKPRVIKKWQVPAQNLCTWRSAPFRVSMEYAAICCTIHEAL